MSDNENMDIFKGLLTTCSYCFWLILLGEGAATLEGRRYGCRQLLVEVRPDSESLGKVQVESAQIDDLDICEVSVSTSPGYRIRAEISFIRNSQRSPDCSAAFLNVGNDRYGAYVQSMTSYKLCNQSEPEIVSRGTSMWFVLGSTIQQNAYGHVLLDVHREDIGCKYRHFVTNSADPDQTVRMHMLIGIYTGRKVGGRWEHAIARCSGTEFECSPVQCVPWSAVCDGIRDCQNGRDEYCVNTSRVNTQTEPCFQCRSGACIRPKLPRYHDDWGKPLWFLCDNIRHCTDGTDERFDVCYRRDGRRDKVIACEPVSDPGSRQLMWRKGVECNNVQDCMGGEDEENCNPQTVTDPTLDTTPIFIVTVAGCILLAGAFIIRRQFGKQEKKRLNTSSEMNTSSEDVSTMCQCARVRPTKFSKHQLSNIKEETECFITTV